MSSLNDVLPPPQHQYTSIPSFSHTINLAPNPENLQVEIARLNAKIPPYGQRQGYVPREPADFGDGGAFPEIWIKQYPLDMGRKNASSSSSVVPVKVNEKGEIQYDAILRENMRKDQIMHSKYEDLIPKDVDEENLCKPSQEEQEKECALTRAAIDKMIEQQLQRVRPAHLAANQAEPVTVRYTAGTSNDAHASGARSRLIKIYEMPVDPLDPPRFRHKKLPPRPPSPPVPIMRSPPRQVTVEDQKNWKIPPCISNWKNNKGFTLPLHQRLAADGRGLYNHVINDKFAKFSEALLIAERQARKEVEARAQMRMKLAKKEKEQREKELAAMAKAAKDSAKYNKYTDQAAHDEAAPQVEVSDGEEHERRRERDIADYDGEAARKYQEEKQRRREKDERRGSRHDDRNRKRKRKRSRDRDRDADESESDSHSESTSDSESESADDDERKKAFAERERIRKERERERKREYRVHQKRTGGRTQSTRQRERDISEKIALGEFTGKKSTESLYDNRLFNQESGLNAGNEADDRYNIYDKPLFQSRSKRMYRPSQLDDDVYGLDGGDLLNEKSKQMKPHKGFDGAEQNEEDEDGGAAARSKRGGFEFEKEESDDSDEEEARHGMVVDNGHKRKQQEMERDELQDELERFTSVKERKKKNEDEERRFKQKGFMYAAAGGASLRDKDEYVASGGRDKVGFEVADKDADDVNYNQLEPGLRYNEKAQREKERDREERRSRRESDGDGERDIENVRQKEIEAGIEAEGAVTDMAEIEIESEMAGEIEIDTETKRIRTETDIIGNDHRQIPQNDKKVMMKTEADGELAIKQ
eukprot:CAMPEP_0197030688 /NCGR_PEP_ID=MMETSP1384-20130603/9863_1 /TAXON_ID=29189 /ORGANISM="Ammonia sp." /LENGTH=818 /DNA_ID=CAMNT_0042460085 /DNA_START=9 /DNA_END=2466 /DNA_ORIENTATION=+